MKLLRDCENIVTKRSLFSCFFTLTLLLSQTMKKDIHPKYFAKAKTTCVCGATYDFGSTKETINIEICGNCHPFYTGNEKVLDTAGRVEKFKARKAAAVAKTPVKKASKSGK